MKRILLVEDDFAQRDLYAELFESAGFSVDTAFDGEEAWQKAELARPDLLFVGTKLSGMSGFELVEKFRNHKTLGTVPAVLFAHLGHDEDRVKAQKLSDAHLMVKGYDNPSDILKYVQESLQSQTTPAVTVQPTNFEDDPRPPGITF